MWLQGPSQSNIDLLLHHDLRPSLFPVPQSGTTHWLVRWQRTWPKSTQSL